MNKNERLFVHHYAITKRETLPESQKLYSHAWLKERDLPSGLDQFVVSEAVGVAVIPTCSGKTGLATEKEAVMARIAGEMMRDGRKTPQEIRRAMLAAATNVKEW